MKQVFVDTSAFAALADKNDDNHAKAVDFNKTISGIRLVTTNYVLDELYTLLLLHAGYSKTVQFKHRLDFLITRKALVVVWISEAIATQTWQIFEQLLNICYRHLFQGWDWSRP
jgi:uncharacterized protein